MSLILYSTQGCHLCEQALVLAHSLGVTPEVVDIAFDDDLYAKYGWSIPVLNTGSHELNWPFDRQQLAKWFTTHGITHNT